MKKYNTNIKMGDDEDENGPRMVKTPWEELKKGILLIRGNKSL